MALYCCGGEQCRSHNCSPPWCTMCFTGAQCSLVVHKAALYHCAGAQGRSHKPRPTDRQILPNVLSACCVVDNKSVNVGNSRLDLETDS